MTPNASPDHSSPLPPEALLELPNVSRETLDRLNIYSTLLERWQARMNLVSPESLRDRWRRHFLDSAQLAAHLDEEVETITDLGTGAGFPGMVLAIVTGHATHLVESNSKKCVFLREVGRETAAPVTIHDDRIEDLVPWPSDVIVARALAPLDRLLGMAARFSPPSGANQPICLFLKGKTAASELTRARKMWNMRAQLADSLSDPSGCVLRVSGFSKIR